MTSDSSSLENAATRGAFAPTRWTLILRARGETPESRAALSELCDAYYQPVLRFLRREGRDEDSARELTQEFFARILSNGAFEQADPERGRFRSYLLGALKHFLADKWDKARRQKCDGGGQIVAQGTSEEITACEISHTGMFLRDMLKPQPPRRHAAKLTSPPAIR